MSVVLNSCVFMFCVFTFATIGEACVPDSDLGALFQSTAAHKLAFVVFVVLARTLFNLT